MKEWKKEDFENFLPKLEQLSIGQLKEIAQKTGVKFTNDAKMKNISKDEILLVLDETDKDKLITAYEEMISRE